MKTVTMSYYDDETDEYKEASFNETDVDEKNKETEIRILAFLDFVEQKMGTV